MKIQKIVKKLRWYAARLRVMEWREIAHRISEAFITVLFLCRYALSPVYRALDAGTPARYAFASPGRAPSFSRQIRFTHLTDAELTELSRPASAAERAWHVAQNTGNQWPRKFYGLVDFRAANPTGDARTTWELSRLQVLVDKACAYRQSDDASMRERIAADIVETFLSWDAENPFLCGINYISAMECGLRIIALTTAFDIIRADVPDTAWPRLAAVVTEHATLIHHRVSRHSSAGNHTVTEAAGLVFAGLLFREHRSAGRWLARGTETLEHELMRQIHADGGSLEQASDYLELVAELGLLVDILMHGFDLSLRPAVLQRLDQAQGFLLALHYSPTNSFHFGDSDSSHALSRHAALLSAPSTEAAPAWRVTRFAESGLTCLDWRVEGEQSHAVKLLFHHHNLGMPPLFGHGHAGTLAIELAVDGCERLIDCGTYAYNSQDDWRSYLRGSRAHNTITVDDQDPARQLSNFQWSGDIPTRLIEPGCELANGCFGILAAHDGYLDRGIIHYRGLIIDRRGELVVWDHLAGAGLHLAECNWHVADGCAVEGSGYRLGAGPLWMELPGSNDATIIYYKNSSPKAGWRSRQYGTLEGAHTLSTRLQGNLPLTLITRLRIGNTSECDQNWWLAPLEQLRRKI